jgi:putative ABC transport system permease protein
MSQGIALTVTTVLVGAALLTRLIADLLYRVSPHDPLAFGLTLGVMTIASQLTCLLPAWHAMRIDPIRALRDAPELLDDCDFPSP